MIVVFTTPRLVLVTPAFRLPLSSGRPPGLVHCTVHPTAPRHRVTALRASRRRSLISRLPARRGVTCGGSDRSGEDGWERGLDVDMATSSGDIMATHSNGQAHATTSRHAGGGAAGVRRI
jgi:hypothetical protein